MYEKEAGLLGDPAANSKEEIIFSYPGLYAILLYRYAHVLYELKVPFNEAEKELKLKSL